MSKGRGARGNIMMKRRHRFHHGRPKRMTAIPDSPDAMAFLQHFPKLYVVGCWARYGVREYYYSRRSTPDGIPLVWDYDDHNGIYPEWLLLPLEYTTTGRIFAWTTSKAAAEKIADALNNEEKNVES